MRFDSLTGSLWGLGPLGKEVKTKDREKGVGATSQTTLKKVPFEKAKRRCGEVIQ